MKTTSADFDKDVREGEGLILVKFGATWCGPCRTILPVLERVVEENDGVSLVSVDIDECRDLAVEFSLTSVPTILFFRDGEVVGQSMGSVSYAKMMSRLAPHLS